MSSSVEPGQVNPDAFGVGQLAQSLVASYFAHTAAIRVARHPQAHLLLPVVEPDELVPVARVGQKDGGEFSFHFAHYLDAAQSEDQDAFERVFLAGALLTLGDALSSHRYFDHAPELELVRHLRNGVAHGNRFNIDQRGAQTLARWPAHNRLAWVKSDTVTFEITPSLHGSEVLWQFMEPGDVVSLLQAVNVYLIRVGNGDPLRSSEEGGG